MASRLIDLISKKKNRLHVQHTFSSNKQKKNCKCSTLFCLSLAVVLHDYNAVLYNLNVKLPSYKLFLWRKCHMCLPNILFPVFMFAFIFHRRSFSPWWPLAFLTFSPPLWISMFFFLRNSSLLFSITRASSFSVIHVSVNIKNNSENDRTLLLFFLSKSPGGHVISFEIKPWVAFGLPYLLIELCWCACGADGRSGVGRTVYGQVITKFSRMGRLPHFLSYGAPSTHGAWRGAWSSARKWSVVTVKLICTYFVVHLRRNRLSPIIS